MSEWKKVKLGDILQVKKGDYITKKEAREGIYPVILGGKEPAYFIDKYNHTGKAIVISRSGASAGYVSFWNEPIFVTDGFLIEPKDDITYEFLYYALKSKQAYLHKSQKGAAIPHVTPLLIGDIDFSLPDSATQHHIASILSRYDSLIENYQKQIKLLEEAAQRLYKEWFVDLRFPGHENTKIVDGVPEGWEKKTVESLLVKHMNGGWGKDSSTGSNIIEAPVIRGTDIAKIKDGIFDNLPTRFHTQKDILNKHLEPYDIILELSNGNINNVGRTLLIDESTISQCGENVICASFCKFLRLVDYRTAIIMSLELEEMQLGHRMKIYKKNGTNGINNFDFQGFLKYELILPPIHLSIKLFEEYTKSISNHRIQIRLLTEARDRLLPKLMSRGIYM